jgi:hypothetical protein
VHYALRPAGKPENDKLESNLSLFVGPGNRSGSASVRKGTQITVETDPVLIIRRRHATRAWCRECGCEADFVPVEQMGRLVRLGPETPDPKPGEDRCHVARGEDGLVLVCLDSWLRLP